ncbi:unnamed protein product [Prunus armeniaca]
MAYVVREGGKKMVLSSAAKKWKDFKSTLTRQFILPFANEKEKLKKPPQLFKVIPRFLRPCILSSHREGRNASATIGCLEKGTLVWSMNWKKPCPVKKSIDLCYGRRQEKINKETSLIQRLQRRQN